MGRLLRVVVKVSLFAPFEGVCRHRLVRISSAYPRHLYAIELCRADVCTTTTTAAMVLDPSFVTDITEVDPHRIAGPYLSIGIGLLDVSDLVNLDISIEHVDTLSPVYVFSGGVAFEAFYPNGVNCPPPCWSATIAF